MIKGVKLINIPVTNQDRALSFYTEKLGFRIATDRPYDDKQRWIELSIPGADVLLTLFCPPGEESRIGSFFPATFYCDNVQRTYNDLSARGVEFLAPPKKEPWGTFTMFKDPDGNQFLLSTK